MIMHGVQMAILIDIDRSKVGFPLEFVHATQSENRN